MDYKKWMLDERGIKPDTLDRWGVEVTDDSIKFHYPEGVKIRRQTPEGRKFSYEGKSSLYHRGPLHKTAFLVEGESDTLIHDQNLVENGYGDKASVVGMSGVNGWKGEYARLFDGVERIRVVLDNDSDYSVRSTVDKAYSRIAADLGRQRVRRIYLPDDAKDLCEFYSRYSFRSFIEIAKPSNQTNYSRLDLSATPPIAEWLVEGLICKGDITLVTGPPNIGKSMVSAGLGLAVAEGWKTFLGQPLNVPPEGLAVLHVDEENPLDQAYARLLAMGMTDKGKKNIHYYHSQGIRLDRDPEKLLDDAMIIKPSLIILDAITRMHSKEENDSGAINQLFNESIIPLGRSTGAAVVVIHAVNKGEGNNSFNKIRGSSDFGYAIDNGIEITPTRAVDDAGQERDALKLEHFKSRRTKKGARFQVFISVNPVGDISLDVAKDGF